MFGASYVRVVGYIGDGYMLCVECAEKKAAEMGVSIRNSGLEPYRQYQADSQPVGEENFCDRCLKEIGE